MLPKMFAQILLTILGLIIISACTGAPPSASVNDLATPSATPSAVAIPLPTVTKVPTAAIEGLPTSILETPQEGLIISDALSGNVLYQLSFDAQHWTLVDSGRILSRWRLEHRNIAGCIIEPTGGMGLPPNYNTQHEFRDFGSFNWMKITVLENNKPIFINYNFGGFTLSDDISWGMIFRVEFTQDAEECVREAEKVLETLQPIAQH